MLINTLYRAARLANFEGIWKFSVPSIILADLLGNTFFLNDEFKRSWFVIFGLFLCFKVRCLRSSSFGL